MQQGQKTKKTIRKVSVGRGQETRPCVQDEGFGEIPKESIYARVGKKQVDTNVKEESFGEILFF